MLHTFLPLYLPFSFLFYSLVSGPATISIPNLGRDYDGPFDSSICDNLTQLGYHSLARDRREAVVAGRTPTLIEAIPAHSLTGARVQPVHDLQLSQL